MVMDYKAEYDKTRAMYAEAERQIKSMKDELSDMEGLREKIEDGRKWCENEIRKIDIEMARLQSRRECYEDRRAMLWAFLN